MYNTTVLFRNVKNKYNEYKNEFLKDKDRKELTDEEGKAINEQVLKYFTDLLEGEKPCVNPDYIVEIFSKEIPSIKRINSDRDKRIEKHNKALKAYIASNVEIQGHIEGYNGDLGGSRQEENFKFLVELDKDNKKRKSYQDLYKKASKKYYINSGKSEDEIAKEIKAAVDKKNRINFDIIKKIVDEKGEMFTKEMSDEDLIVNYSDIVKYANIINESVALIDNIKENIPDGITKKELTDYRNKIGQLMMMATKYQKRMAILADPFYADINLEALLDATPAQLSKLGKFLQENLKTMPLTNKNLRRELSLNEADVKEADNMEEVIKASKEVNNYVNKIHVDESILTLPNDMAFVAVQPYNNKLDDLVHESYSLHNIACDKNGNEIEFTGEVCEMLDKNNGEIYIIDKFNAHDPIPVIIDQTQPKYTVLMGDEVKTPVPEAVMNFNREYNKNNVEQGIEREKTIDSLIKCIKYIDKNDAKSFENVLGTILAKKGLNSKVGQFRSTVLKMLNFDNRNFVENDEIANFRKNEQFREFVWKLRKDRRDLVEKLWGDNVEDANEALNDIIEIYKQSFDNAKPWAGKISDEFKELLEAEKVANEASKLRTDEHPLSIDDVYTLKSEMDNRSYWNSIKAIYGSKRKFHGDWISEISDGRIYSLKDFMEMKESDVDLDNYKINNKPLDDETFAALGMMLSLREKEFFTPENMASPQHMPDTMPFEDIILKESPRENTGMILKPIVEPTRRTLLENLNQFNGEGANNMAKDLAKALKIYAKHIKSFGWDTRKNSSLTMVADKVLDFAEKHGLMDKIKENGLTSKDLKLIKTTNAIGKVVKEGFDAEAELQLEKNGNKELSVNERMDCINKIMRLKAVKVDLEAIKENPVFPEYKAPKKKWYESANSFKERQRLESEKFAKQVMEIEENTPVVYGRLEEMLMHKDSFYADELGCRMISREEREKLANKGSKAILDKINCSFKDSDYKWVEKIKKNPEEENTNRMKANKLRLSFERNIKALENIPGQKETVDFANRIIATGDYRTMKKMEEGVRSEIEDYVKLAQKAVNNKKAVQKVNNNNDVAQNADKNDDQKVDNKNEVRYMNKKDFQERIDFFNNKPKKQNNGPTM